MFVRERIRGNNAPSVTVLLKFSCISSDRRGFITLLVYKCCFFPPSTSALFQGDPGTYGSPLLPHCISKIFVLAVGNVNFEFYHDNLMFDRD